MPVNYSCGECGKERGGNWDPVRWTRGYCYGGASSEARTAGIGLAGPIRRRRTAAGSIDSDPKSPGLDFAVGAEAEAYLAQDVRTRRSLPCDAAADPVEQIEDWNCHSDWTLSSPDREQSHRRATADFRLAIVGPGPE
jgi:hypothetical protein